MKNKKPNGTKNKKNKRKGVDLKLEPEEWR